MKTLLRLILFFCFSLSANPCFGQETREYVAVLSMDMMILPGTQSYLEESIARAGREGAKIIVVNLDTPGGVLLTSQEMVQAILNSPIPIVIYVSPSGSTATSAGVFITMAAHIAAMAPGTSIGAAHPVTGEGKDIEGDMRKKAENMTIAMVKAISEQRGRNIKWAEQSVKESSSATAEEALKENVIDLLANDITSLLESIAGKKIKLGSQELELEDYSNLPRIEYEIATRDKVINVLANPNVAALLWMGATTGLSLEIYNPGAILPGVVGLICLVLALQVSQVIPISQSGILLLVLGAALIIADFFVGSAVLAVGGIIALAFGAVYLIDVSQAPGLEVSTELICSSCNFF